MTKSQFKKAYRQARKLIYVNGMSSLQPLLDIGFTKIQALDLIFPTLKAANVGYSILIEQPTLKSNLKNGKLYVYGAPVNLFNY